MVRTNQPRPAKWWIPATRPPRRMGTVAVMTAPLCNLGEDPAARAWSAKPPWPAATVAAALLTAGLVALAAPVSAEPKQDDDTKKGRTFSDFILGSLCQEGLPGTPGTGFSCTMPDGSVWTCHPVYGGYNYCVQEGTAHPTGPGQRPQAPLPTDATQAPPPPPPGPVTIVPSAPPASR